MSKESENLSEGLKRSPNLIALIVVVGCFLYYLYRHDQMKMQEASRDDLVAKQRIEQCHSIQHESNLVMDKLNTSLNNQGNAFRELTTAIRDLRVVMEAHNGKMVIILHELNQIKEYIKEVKS